MSAAVRRVLPIIDASVPPRVDDHYHALPTPRTRRHAHLGSGVLRILYVLENDARPAGTFADACDNYGDARADAGVQISARSCVKKKFYLATSNFAACCRRGC